MKTWQDEVRKLCKAERDRGKTPREIRRGDPTPYRIPAEALKLVKIAFHNGGMER